MTKSICPNIWRRKPQILDAHRLALTKVNMQPHEDDLQELSRGSIVDASSP